MSDESRKMAMREVKIDYRNYPAHPTVAHTEAKKDDEDRQLLHNRLRILMNLDRHDLPGLDDHVWENFKRNPHREFIRCDDRNCRIIWQALRDRERLTQKRRQLSEGI